MQHDTTLDVQNVSRDWTIAQAIGELLQNAIDETANGATMQHGWIDGTATITDNGGGIPRTAWAFGASDKKEGSIGQWGNGLKRGLVVLTRAGRKVIGYTSGDKITPKIMPFNLAPDGKRLTLWLDFEPIGETAGTSWQVECTEEEYSGALVLFEKTEDTTRTNVQTVTLRGETTVKATTPGGWVYVNGARVSPIAGSALSYHLYGEAPRKWVNESRTSIDNYALQNTLRTFYTSAVDAAKSLFSAYKVAHDTGAHLWEENVSLWFDTQEHADAFRAVYGKRACVASDNWNNDEHYGYKPVLMPRNWTIEKAEPVKRGAAQGATAHGITAEERANLEACKRILRRAYVLPHIATKDGIRLSSGIMASGLWCPSEGRIWIDRSILSDRRETLSVLIHELAHQISGAADNTDSHMRAATEIAARLLI